MPKKLIKSTITITIILLTTFMFKIDAKAARCEYISPMTFKSSNNASYEIRTTINYNKSWFKYRNSKNTILTHFTLMSGMNTAGQVYDVGFRVNPAIGDSTTKGLSIPDTNRFSFSSETTLPGVTPDFNLNVPNVTLCPTYVKLEYTDYYHVTESSENEFEAYIKNDSNIGNCSTENPGTQACLVALTFNTLSHKDRFGSLDDPEESLSGYIKQHGSIVYIENYNQQKYPSTKLNMLKKELKSNNSEEAANKLINTLSSIMDMSDTNELTVNDTYYNLTKDDWHSLVSKYLVNDTNKSEIYTNDNAQNHDALNEAFQNWFYMTGRYILEEDPDKFIKYVKFLSEGRMDDSTRNQYYEIMRSIKGIKDLDNINGKEDKINNDTCLSLCKVCLTSSGTGCEECKKSSDYKECSTCVSKANNIPDTSSQQAAIKSCMGETLYETYEKTLQETKDEIVKEKENVINQITSALSNIKLPTLNVETGKIYEVQCEDVTVFHTIYIMIIAAGPVLTIVLGTLDYAKAVIASDEKKMQEFKSKFPKRVLALILLIVTPIIVSLLIKIISPLSTSLLSCVVNG